MSDDAEFDAFLKGEGELSRRLQGMQQDAPGAALDAAILQRARDLMAQEARPAAANDPGEKPLAPRLAGPGWRWRLPGAIAATVLAGVFAHQAFQASADLERQAGLPAEVSVHMTDQPAAAPPAPMMEAVAPAPAPMMVPAPPPAAQTDALARNRAPAKPMQKMDGEAARSAPEAPMQSVEITATRPKAYSAETALPIAAMTRESLAPPPPPAPASVAEYKAAPAMPAAAPVSAGFAAADQREQMQSADKAARQEQERDYSVSKRGVAAPKTAAEWLAAIEAKLGTGKDTEVLIQWRAFRQAYPGYPVPQTTEEKIKAIEQ